MKWTILTAFQPTLPPVPKADFSNVIILHAVLEPLEMEVYIADKEILELAVKESLSECLKSETIRIRKLSNPSATDTTGVSLNEGFVNILLILFTHKHFS